MSSKENNNKHANHSLTQKTKEYTQGIDWVYIVFLFLIANQAMFSLKLLGIVFIYVLRPNFSFGFKDNRLPMFYVYIIALSIFSYFFHIRDFSLTYLVIFFVGNLFWLFSLLAIHQTKISMERYGPQGVYRTLKVLTILNLAFSLYQLGKAMVATGSLNPYTNFEFPYGMSTGDNIFGFFMENSYHNIILSASMAIYFIFKRKLLYAFINVFVFALVFGNFGTIIFITVLCSMMLGGIYIKFPNAPFVRFVKQISPKGNFGLYIPLFIIYMVSFLLLASPENMKYVIEKIEEKVFLVATSDKNYRNIIHDNQKIDAKTAKAFERFGEVDEFEIGSTPKSSLTEQSSVLGTISSSLEARKEMTEEYIYKLQGKALSLKETIQFLKSSPSNLFLGAGTARFSSLLAQKVAGFDSSRIFMNVIPRFESPEFSQNHKLLLEVRMESEDVYHATSNWSDSLYNHLLGEYGLIGGGLFLVFYLWYFIRRIQSFTYSFWIILFFIPSATLLYIFEALDVLVIFELMVFADIEEHKQL